MRTITKRLHVGCTRRGRGEGGSGMGRRPLRPPPPAPLPKKEKVAVRHLRSVTPPVTPPVCAKTVPAPGRDRAGRERGRICAERGHNVGFFNLYSFFKRVCSECSEPALPRCQKRLLVLTWWERVEPLAGVLTSASGLPDIIMAFLTP